MMRLLANALKPLRRKLRQLITRGVVTLVDPNQLLQLLQVELLGGEVLDQVEHFEAYGFTAHPHNGAEVLAASLNGQRSHTVVITVGDRRYRLKGLAQGEVAIYDDLGQKVHLTRTGIVIKSDNVTIDAPLAKFTGDIDITGEATISGIAFTAHVHPENDNGGPTGVPQ